MKERWINAGFDDDELKPYAEPDTDISDQKRIGKKNHFVFYMVNFSTKLCHSRVYVAKEVQKMNAFFAFDLRCTRMVSRV